MTAIFGQGSWKKKKPDGRIAFGSSVERKMFPIHSDATRMGIEQGVRSQPHVGPGRYESDPMNTFQHQMDAHPCSTRGYGFGASGSKRSPVPIKVGPGPGEYQAKPSPFDTEIKPAYCPFNSASPRLKDSVSETQLGPGSYEHSVAHDRHVSFEESFGGPKHLKATITVKCTLGIPDKCKICEKEPVGDYYENNKFALCRPCFNSIQTTKVGDGDIDPSCLKGMKKVRDCSSIHKHEFPGREPKVVLVSEKDQKKLRYREAYLSQYF